MASDTTAPEVAGNPVLDQSNLQTEQASKQDANETHHHSSLEDAPASDSRLKEETSINIVLGILVSFACSLGAFVEGLTILHSQRTVLWAGVARLVRTSIEAYAVGHLLLHMDHTHRLKYIFAVSVYVLAFPCAILLSVLFGSTLAAKTSTSLLIRWLLLSASFGTIAYIIIFHIISTVFNSGQRKKTLFLVFVLGQAVSFGLVARPL